MNQEFMKEKPVMPLVISMALPMTVSMLVNALYNIVDSYFVARISENAMTALSLVYPIQNIITATAVGFGIGINAMIAYHLGAKNQEMADRSASLGTALNIFHGILLTIVCMAIMPTFLRLFTQQEEVLKMGLQYSRIVILFSIPISISISFEKIFQAVGKMSVSMICMLLGCVTNIILDPLFIFGIGFFPKLGIQGAAIATGIGQVVTLIGYLVMYVYRPIPVTVSKKHVKMDGALCKKLYSIGIPATLNMALSSVQVSVLNGILAAYSASYVLVLGAYFKLQTFLYLTANGVVQGMRPLLSYNYGAGEMKRVKKIFGSALFLIVVVMAFGTILCLWTPQTLIGLFTSQQTTIEIGKTTLRIISLGFVVSSVSVTVCGALEALGKGMESLVVSMLRYVIVMLPMAFILSRIFGAVGVWHGFWTTELITALISWQLYRKNIHAVE